MKKILSVLLAVMMILSCLPVMAEEGTTFARPNWPGVTPKPTATAKPTAEPTAEPTATPTPAPTATPAPDVEAGLCKGYESQAVVIAEATCTETGLVEYPCVVCETAHTFKVEIPALGHEAKAGTATEITKVPTCTEDGIRHYAECVRSTEKNPHGFDEVVKAEHKWVKVEKDAVVAPTCTEEGYTKYVCENCDETLKGDIVEKLGHEWVKNEDGTVKVFTETQVPHCDQPGMNVEFTMCGREGCFHKDVIKTSSNNWSVESHQAWMNEFIAIAKDAKDVEAATWAVANKILNAATTVIDGEKFIPEMDVDIDTENEHADQPTTMGKYHPVHVEYVESTCTVGGYITLTCTGANCDGECGATATLELPALDHVYVVKAYDYEVRLDKDEDGNYVFEGVIPSCTEGGKALISCARCDLTPEQIELPSAGGHVYEKETAFGKVTNWYYSQKTNFAPEFTTKNLSEIAECHEYTIHKICLGNIYNITVDINGHEIPVVFVIYCNHETTEVKAGNGKCVPSAENYAYEAPTCYSEGYEYYNCANCGCPAGGKLEKIDHDLKATTEIKPTCTEAGLIVWACQVKECGYTSEQIVPATGHKLVAGEGKEATCTTDGYVRETCIYCGKNFDTVIPAAHTVPDNFFEIIEKGQGSENGFAYTAPTCTKDGSMSFQCEVCHKYVYNQTVPALGHTYERRTYVGNVIDETTGEQYDSYTAANCQHGAYYTRTCGVCKHVDKTAETAKLGHLLAAYNHEAAEGTEFEGEKVSSLFIQKLPTCEEEGLAYYNCAVCKALVKDFVLPKLPHNEVITWNETESKFEITCEKYYIGSNNAYTAAVYAGKYLYAEIVACTEDAKLANKIWENVVDDLFGKMVDSDAEGLFVKGVGCGQVINEIKVNKTHYDIAFDSTSNTVVLTPDENIALLKEAYVIVNWDYTLSDGTIFSYTRSFEETSANTYKLGLAKTPAGAVLNAVTIIVTDDANSIEITEAAKGYGIEQF